MKNKLNGCKFYLCGPITADSYKEETWRNNITPFLESMNVVVLDPCKKPSETGKEDKDRFLASKEAKARGDFETVAAGKEVRTVDLRCVDISDALIAVVDMDQKPFGTIEEIVLANRQKKPVLVWCVGGRKAMNDWLFWMLPLEMLFDDLESLKQYLVDINNGGPHHKRWVFFDFNKVDVS